MLRSRAAIIAAVTLACLIALLAIGAWGFGIEYSYTLQTVAIGGGLLGLISGVIGSFGVLRQQSLMGDAISHAALPGVAIAFLIAGRELGALMIGAGIASLLGVYWITAVTQTSRIKQDTAMGIVLVSWFAFGIALLSYIQGRPDASQAGLDRFIFGQAAAITAEDVRLITVIGTGLLLITALFWKEFKLIAFNYEFAAANGYPVRFLDALLSLMIVITIVLGLQLAGVILMVGLLIAPAVAARQWVTGLGAMVGLAGVFGLFAGMIGSGVSALDVGLPTGPMIILIASLIVAIALLFAPERGVIAQWRRTHQTVSKE
ncbi:MAG: metal ABC transporter permease [Anaerolineae bacterium]|nr:metal ABC transporter permease [Anaerolineae bacterium]